MSLSIRRLSRPAILSACAAMMVSVAGCDRAKDVSDSVATSATKKSKGSVPSQLFEVQIGKVYRFSRDGDFNKSELPVAKVTGSQQALGIGFHFYFQPRKIYEAFPYLEKRAKPDDQYFETSYRLYMMPVVPKGTKSLDDINKAKFSDFEVLLIEWSEPHEGERDDKKKDEDYFWAQSMCKTFEADLGVKPKVVEQFVPRGDKSTVFGSVYTCTFSEGNREFEVSSMFGRVVKLAFTNEVTTAKGEAFEMTVRKLQAPSIRPY